MKQEDKELLLRDLCARLPYGVKVAEFDNNGRKISMTAPLTNMCNDESHYCDLKPYLFPLSSMTDDQAEELQSLIGEGAVFHRFCLEFIEARGYSSVSVSIVLETIDWLNEHHFDYRGLIEKGLAIDATNLNIY